jgi:23S rRNA (guanosine2251-2'-O)-methyltransferase
MGKSDSQFIFGIRPVIEAIRSGKEIEKILVRRDLRGETIRELLILIRKEKIPVQYVPVEKINRVTRKNHQGVLAFIAVLDYTRIDELLPSLYEDGKSPFLIMPDGITDVRNLGAIVRTAESAGAHGMILPQKRSSMLTADTIKTSAGALYYLPVCRTDNVKETLVYLRESGLQLVAASEKAGKYYFEVDFIPPTLIIMGAEDKGLSKEVLKLVDELVNIPMAGKIDSLNVSAAAAVLFYEVVRQRAGSE